MRSRFASSSIVVGVGMATLVAGVRADDHGNSCGTATPIATDGTVVDAIIDPVSDEDWLSFTATAGDRYEATTFIGSAAFYYDIQVIGPDCGTVLADWGYGSPDERSVTTPTSDTYYIRIASLSGAFVGYMQLGLTDRGAAVDDHSGGRAGATPILTDGSVSSGVINYLGDVDWFGFTGVGQHLYRMEIRATAFNPYFYAAGDLYVGGSDVSGSGWSYSTAAADGDWMSCTYYVPPGPSVPMFVRVVGFPDMTGPYEMRVTEIAAPSVDDHGDNCGGATPVSPDGSVTDIFIDPPTDQDWLSFTAAGGNLYQLTTLRPSGAFNSLIDLIADDCATVLAQWGPANQNELSFFAPYTGTYYVRATSADLSTVGYVGLGVTDRGPQSDDYSGAQADATPVPVDGTVINGTINYAGDYDYFTFEGLPDHLYSVQVRALAYVDYWTVATSLFQGPAQLDFTYWSYGGPGGPGAWSGLVYGFTVANAGPVQVLVYAGLTDSGGSYELKVIDLGPTPADDHGDDAVSATPLATDGTPVGGVLGHGGDQDWFVFPGLPQRVYSIEVQALDSPDSGGAGGSVIGADGLSDLGGTGWSWAGPGLDGDWARVFYYVPADAAGDYYVDVQGYGFTAGNYRTRVILGAGQAGDFDGDGIPDSVDNCPTVPNPDQTDTDGDGIGDCCDPDAPDADGDGVADACDNCPTTYNPDQADSNGNGIGDACELSPCPGDLNNDRVVNLGDLAQLLSHYGLIGSATPADGDLDGDLDVDLGDLSNLISHYGDVCP